MHTVTKKELVDRIADQTGGTRVVVKKVVQSFLDEIINELAQGNRLEFRDFGVFETKERAARIAQNPKTLQRVHVPPKRTVKFKVGRLMKQRLQQSLSVPEQPGLAKCAYLVALQRRRPAGPGGRKLFGPPWRRIRYRRCCGFELIPRRRRCEKIPFDLTRPSFFGQAGGP